MSLRKWLAGLVVVASFVTLPAMARVYTNIVITDAPPPVRVERVVARPGYVWAPGYWDWHHGRYVWVRGSWRRARPGYRWIAPEWYHGGGDRSYRFKPGRWERDSRWDRHPGRGWGPHHGRDRWHGRNVHDHEWR